MKELKHIFFIIFTFSFLIFIFEPLFLFFCNIHDLNYDIYIITPPLLISFILSFVFLSTIVILINKLNEKKFKKKNLINFITLISFLLLISLFIQGLYFSNSLPKLDGDIINWNKYVKENIISIVMWISVFVTGFIINKKIGYKKFFKIVPIICTGMIVLTIVILGLETFILNGFISRKDLAYSTTENLNTISSNHNFIILILDTVDSSKFHTLIDNDEELREVFNDFTYFPDTTGAYYFTETALPHILTGEWFENKEDFLDYYDKAMDNCELFSNLKKNDYSINLYLDEIKWRTSKYKEVDNLRMYKSGINELAFIKEQIRYDLFTFLPFPLKRFSKIENLDLNSTRPIDKEEYNWKDKKNYKNFKNNDLEVIDQNVFKVIHLEGGHLPCNLNKNMEKGKFEYEDKIAAAITVTKEFINQLKRAGAYDNTSIIVLADHGYIVKENQDLMDPIVMKRQNPILLVKGENESHELYVSDKQVSFVDLNSIYNDLLEYKKSDEILENVNHEYRRLLLYRYQKKEHMEEYHLVGNAWNSDNMKKTGKKYDR